MTRFANALSSDDNSAKKKANNKTVEGHSPPYPSAPNESSPHQSEPSQSDSQTIESISEPVLNTKAYLSMSDFLAGISQLAVIGVIETTGIVESIHREIVLRPLGLSNHKYGRLWHKGIGSRVYSLVKGVTSVVGHSLAFGITQYNQLLGHKNPQPLPASLTMLVNTINGVMGDHLVTNHNPLALPMILYTSHGEPLVLSQQSEQTDQASGAENLSSTVVILLHGLCMGYVNWQPDQSDSLGQMILKRQPEVSVLYLNYNTGRRISINGREFAKLLQTLVTKHPNITKINLVGHSMGGLVSRSALYYGSEISDSWVSKVDKLITLGTPHHGAVLERIGDIVQQSISKLPFAGSLGKLGDIRSTGIIDLRHGSVRDEDWQSLATRSVLPDSERQVTPLPPHITAYFLAGTLSETEEKDSSKMSYLLGDGLVNINSALGEHTEMHTLQVPRERKKVFYGVGHFGLLSDKQVLDQAIDWLSDSQ